MSNWTREDLPDRYDLQRLKSGIVQPFFFDDILDAVVEHLNRAHPKPEGIVTYHWTYHWTHPNERDDIKKLRRERDELEAANEKLHREWTAEFIRANHAEAERDELRAVFTAEKDELVRLATKEN